MTTTIRAHHRLRAWSLAMDLVTVVYARTGDFPESERFGLVTQMRRAAISIPCNVAEGAARGRPREFFHYLDIARGSAAELETQLQIANRLGFVGDDDELRAVLDEVFACLAGLRRRISSKLADPSS